MDAGLCSGQHPMLAGWRASASVKGGGSGLVRGARSGDMRGSGGRDAAENASIARVWPLDHRAAEVGGQPRRVRSFAAMRRPLLALLVALSAGTASAVLAPGAQARVVLYDLRVSPHVHPRRVQFNFREYAFGLNWRHWGDSTATAKGTMSRWFCPTFCAEGYARRYPGRVTVWRLRRCRGDLAYTRSRVRYRVARRWRTYRGAGIYACPPV
jgi:hypothetical protein